MPPTNGYPIVDCRNPLLPQPEVCSLCGLKRPGHEIVYSEIVQGLRGLRICSSTRTCREYRNKMGWKERRRLWRPSAYVGTGKHPIYIPGVEWHIPDLQEGDAAL